MLSGMAFHAAGTQRANSEGAARKGRLKESCGLEPRINFFFRLRNRQKLVRIRFGCGLDPRIYGSWFILYNYITMHGAKKHKINQRFVHQGEELGKEIWC